MKSDDELNISNFKRYLLGTLPSAESEAIDLQVISDDRSEETLLWAENELMEDYLDGALSPTETKLFEANFLVAPERIAQFKQISLLRNYARNAAAKNVPVNETGISPEGLLTRLKNFFSLNRRPAIAFGALIIIGLCAVFYLTANHRTASEKEFAALNHNDLSDLAALKPLAKLSLTSEVFRDAEGDSRRLTAAGLTEKVLFRLALPMPFQPSDTFKAELVKDGKTIYTLDELKFYNNANGQEVRLLLPSTALKNGNSQIKLTKESVEDKVFVYNFAVE